ncbi:MAG: hypothetical protein AAF433_11085 [Bacteroidota bacterium]
MIKTIRDLNFGWIAIVMGLCAFGAGLNMIDPDAGSRTWLCFDRGCVTIQGISVIVVGALFLLVGTYKVIRNR